MHVYNKFRLASNDFIGENKRVEIKWGDKRGSNPRQPEPQSGALPTELRHNRIKRAQSSERPKSRTRNPCR